MILTTPRKLALDLLSRSICKVQVAAVLSDRDGTIFSFGWNSPPRNHVEVKGNHAERMAFSRANRSRLWGATLTVAGRRRKSRNYVLSRPCNKCWPLVLKYDIRRIEYTTPNGEWAEEINL